MVQIDTLNAVWFANCSKITAVWSYQASGIVRGALILVLPR